MYLDGGLEVPFLEIYLRKKKRKKRRSLICFVGTFSSCENVELLMKSFSYLHRIIIVLTLVRFDSVPITVKNPLC